MRARLQAWLEIVGDQFWLRPAVLVVLCIALAETAIWLDTGGVFGIANSSETPWGYSGGAEGARVLLGAVASSSISVASTTFSITIAALSLASAQMGPRLLRNFVRDGRNQLALGIFVGTFAYALVVLRTVRTEQEGAFIPHAAVTGAIILALICVATLVWFVHHIASSINVEIVIDAVHKDLIKAVEAGTSGEAPIEGVSLPRGTQVAVAGGNYLQAVDLNGIADWAAETGTKVRLRVRPGDYVPFGLPVAELLPAHDDAAEAIGRAMTFGRQRAALQDLEYSVRQLSEIAVRALSSGVTDPFTAGSVLERFGDALCRISEQFLPSGVAKRNGEIVLVYPVTDYQGLCDAMFHPIRQNAANSRTEHLSRHADLTVAAKYNLTDQAAVADLVKRHELFYATLVAEAARS